MTTVYAWGLRAVRRRAARTAFAAVFAAFAAGPSALASPEDAPPAPRTQTPPPAAAPASETLVAFYSGAHSSSRTRARADAVRARFAERFAIIDVFLDAGRRPFPDALAEASDALARRFGPAPAPRIALAFGEPALKAALDAREGALASAPLVFAGVADVEMARLATRAPGVAGVLKSLSVGDTADLAVRLNPQPLRRLITIAGDRELIAALEALLAEEAGPRMRGATAEFWALDEMTFEELDARVAAEADPQAAFLFANGARDSAGAELDSAEILARVAAAAQRPVYGLHEDHLAAGAVGGRLLSPAAGAEAALDLAELALASGGRDGPRLINSPNRAVVDHAAAMRFGLALGRVDAALHDPLPPPDPFLTRAAPYGLIAAPLGLLALIAAAAAAAGMAHARRRAANASATLDELLATETKRSRTDALTGLPNRAFLDQLPALLDPSAGPRAVFHIDVDRLSEHNRAGGPAVGDAVLKATAERLREAAGDGGGLARVGDDDFLLVRPVMDEAMAAGVAAELAERLRAEVVADGVGRRVSACVGVAVASAPAPAAADAASEEGAGADAEADQAAAAAAAEEIEPSSAVRDAALALRRAKAQGVGSHAIVSREDRAAARALDELSADVLRGVEAGEFEPFFQPQICAQTGSLVAFEALARWRHPDRGVLAPGAFMEAAEKLGAIAEIDAQIFGKAIAQVKEWSANGQYLPQLSLNVSTRRICSEEVCKQVFDAEFDEATLCFELLESTFLDGGDAVIFDAIQRLRDLGTVFEVDDFGTGHASILSVMRIKPQRLKLARELVESVATDAASQEMVRSIIDIAKSLEIGVNAEGIETDEQMSMLRELGCDVFQGYLIAKPMAAEDAAKFIRGGSAKAVPR